MEPLLSLPRDQFLAALDELQLDPARRDSLVRQYRRQNSPFSAVYGLLDRMAGEDAGEGMERATFAPVSRPAGMSVADAVRSGQAQFAVPQGLLDVVGGVAQAVDAPASAARGLIPADDMTGEALNLAGMAQLGGAAMPAPRGALRSAALGAADDVMETPAQRVARLLRNGRADEVTDDLMAQADPQEMYQLYVSGQTGMDLPMDEASRMARAQEMGFDTDAYHGTGYGGFSAFRGAQTFGATDPADASVYARYGDAGQVYPITMRADNPERFDLLTWDPQREASVFARAREAGHDAYYATDGRRIAFDPTNIRSRFARFDPRLSHLANLNAANIDPLTGAAAMGASQQQQDPLANLRAYIAASGGVLGR